MVGFGRVPPPDYEIVELLFSRSLARSDHKAQCRFRSVFAKRYTLRIGERMETIVEISRWIRDYGHDSRHRQRLLSVRFDWHQLWTALDIIDDVELAIKAYLEGEFPTDPGERYLRVFGIFQALFVQQDALRHFVEILRPSKSLNLVDVLKDVREARNASVGHPTQLERKGDVSAHLINRSSVRKDGFELMSFSEKTGVSISFVQVQDLIAKQRSEAVRLLSEVIKELKTEDEEHKTKFREKSLKESFHLVMYAFEKIFEELRGSTAIVLSKWGADHLQSALDDFEKMLNERGRRLRPTTP